ncbi:MAG: zinc-dependent peptidase [Cyclobacteriaceae bacterium]
MLGWLYGQVCKAIAEARFRTYFGPLFHSVLHGQYKFYNRLTGENKLHFLRLVRDHYEYFDFIPRKIKLTRERKTIISSAAAQRVLRFPPESLTFWTRIIIYSADCESKITGQRHQGEVNPGLRTIVFGWTGVRRGLHRDEDGLNLLLHEFAHALWLEHKLTSHRYSVLDPYWVSEFERLAFEEMKQLQADKGHFFRRYAFGNMEEFFAVAVGAARAIGN